MGIRTPRRDGLVLLVVLGMLALFSLLAITYLTTSQASRSAVATVTRAKLAEMPTEKISEVVVKQMISGTNDNLSGFFGHSLLEDIYGRDAIQGFFVSNSATINRYAGLGAGILKVRLQETVDINPDPFRDAASVQELPEVPAAPSVKEWAQSRLSVNSDTYTGRLITFLEGPLENQTYRILGYWGSPGPLNTAASPPAEVIELRNAIAIDLSETDQKIFRAVNGRRSVEGSLQDWINAGASRLIQDSTGAAYRFVINDLPFNGFGYGVERDSTNVSFGNLDQGQLIPVIGTPNYVFSLPVALLPHYDYIQRQRMNTFDTGVLGQLGGSEVVGSTNEGFDVPDYHDFWLGFVPEGALAGTNPQPQPLTAEIIPSFHRPELVNYIVQTYGKSQLQVPPVTLNKYDILRMVQLIDYACARPLSYRLRDGGNTIVRNLDFSGRNDGRGIPTLDIDVNNIPGSLAEIQEWVGKLIGRGTSATDLGVWDVDNQGRGVADSVWIDPNLPLMTSVEGRKIKVLVAPLILDLDGRLNVNAVGDAIQGNAFAAVGSGSYHTRSQTGNDSGLIRNGYFLPQGLGYGPAEISPAGFFNNGTVTQREQRYATFFGFRYGADFGAGRTVLGGAAIDDLLGRYFKERGLTVSPVTLNTRRGLQQSRRGQIAFGIDPFGNPRMTDSGSLTARTYVNNNPNNPYPECFDDPYESSPNDVASNDTNFQLEELEAILRRYDSDVASLPDRLRRFVQSELGHANLNHAIYTAISTRSNELRYPNMAALARHNRDYAGSVFPRINNDPPRNLPSPPYPANTNNPHAGPDTEIPAVAAGTRLIANGRIDGSFLRWIQLFHQERYPLPAPVLEQQDVKLLFPIEFSKSLRLDLNRPFGNGVDGDNDGMVDEPEELSPFSGQPAPGEAEGFPNVAGTVPGSYYPVRDDFNFDLAASGITNDDINRYFLSTRSRKLLARHLYCIAQLVIDLNHPFGGVVPTNASWIDPTNTVPGNVTYREYRARELAQWAVNVVDFRDTDGAMTRFEYDSTPFAQDSLGVVPAVPDVFGPGHPRQGAPTVWLPEAGNVVWGMEFPDVLLTESLAFHDKRLRDTDDDTGSPPATTTDTNPDNDFDQYRIPQGSLFLELFCPRSNEVATAANTQPSLGAAPGGLYANNGAGRPELQLGAMTPTDAGTSPSTGLYGPQPVFRISISHPIRPGSGEFPEVNPAVTAATPSLAAKFRFTHQTSLYGNTTMLGLTNGYTTSGLINNLADTTQVPTFDRIIWFNNNPGDTATILQVPDLEPPYDLSGPGTINRNARIFYNQANTPVGLEPGRYMVIGPRPTTYIGSNYTLAALPIHDPSAQSISLGTGTVTIADKGGNFGTPRAARAVPPNIQAPLTMRAVSRPPAAAWLTIPDGAACRNGGIGINISEPLATAADYYPLPPLRLNSTDTDGSDGVPGGLILGFNDPLMPADAYVDYSAPGPTLPDRPFDYDVTSNRVLATPGFERFVSGTYANERVAYMQRVADPELPYHPLYNPYITIDWITIDLTVFNGEANATTDPEDMGAYTTLAFQSRYKDGARVTDATNMPGFNPSGPSPIVPPTTRNLPTAAADQTGVSIFSTSVSELRGNTPQPAAASPGEPYFNYELGIEDPPLETATRPYASVSLGYLNHGRQLVDSGSLTPPPPDWDGFGLPQANGDPLYVGGQHSVVAGTQYGNVPGGLFWLNRSFATSGELMLVPRTAPGQFGDSFTTPKSAGAASDRYYIPGPVPPGDFPSPYGYLPSYFSSPILKTVGTAPVTPFWLQAAAPGASTGSSWNLLLELVETQPPFPDSERWIQPNWMIPNTPPPNGGSVEVDYIREYLLAPYLAPRNAFPTYRTPGKVNINTIPNREVWDAVEWNYDWISRDQALSLNRSQAGGRGPWDALKLARRGYPINQNVGAFFVSSPYRNWLINPFLDADTPSQFAGAFRPAVSANMDVPGAIGISHTITPPPRNMRLERGVAATTMRPYATYGPPNTTVDPAQNTGASPTLMPPPVGPLSNTNYDTNVSLVSPTVNGAVPTLADETAHQPFVNYQRMMRLPNLVTHQSNVFAVWVTIGLFEYDEVEGIGAEYIGPSGTPERSKSFYIIDRSIPVGFAPGRSYNADRTILLRRKVPR